MKPLKGDKTDLRPVNIIFSFLILMVVADSVLYGQLPLNGFCSYRKIPVDPAFGKIFTLDYDADSHTDFLLYSSGNNPVAFQKNAENDNKISSVRRYAPFSITEIRPVIQFKRKELLYFAISQKERKAALLSISRGGGIGVNMLYRFDSYPNALAVADINGDGNSEAVVCGNNFRGISLFMLKNRLNEIKVDNEGVFSSIQFIDLNYDGFPDIAAFESRSNSIYFFINDQNGNFRKIRSKKFDPSVRSFKTADVNSDGYMDLIILKQKGIDVIEGDSVSSFRKNHLIKTPVSPDETVIDDYNGDGINDIAYMNKSTGEFFLQINKGNGSYYYPVLLLKKSGFADMKSFRDSFLRKIALLNPDGELYIISKFNSKKDSEKISAFGGVSAISLFESGSAERKELCLVDNYQKAFIMLLGEPGNDLSRYFSVRIGYPHSQIAVDDSQTDEKTFYLYTPGKSFIEIIKYNFQSYKIEKNTLYAKGDIADVKVKRSAGSSYADIHILFNKNTPGYSVYQFKDYRYSEISEGKLESPLINAAITGSDSLSVFCWKRNNQLYEYYCCNFIQPYKSRLVYKYDSRIQDNFSLAANSFSKNLTGDFFNISVISNGRDIDGVLYESGRIKNLNFDVSAKLNPLFSKESFYFYNDNREKRKILFIYDFGNGIFYKADMNSKSRIMSVRGSDKIGGIIKYVVEKSSGKKMKIVYIGNNDNCLNFNEIE